MANINDDQTLIDTVRTMVKLNKDKHRDGLVHLWRFDDIEDERNVERIQTLIVEYHDDDSAESDILLIDDVRYKVECMLSGDTGGWVVLKPVKDAPVKPVAFLPKRDLDSIKAMWIQGLAERKIKMVVPDYSQKPRTSYGLVSDQDKDK